MKKYGGARTMKKKTSMLSKKKPIASKTFTFKNTKSKEKKFQKNIRRLIETANQNDYYSYIKVLRKFEKFFKGIIKLEDKISYANYDTISNFDIKKMEISEKLKDLDTKYGKLLTRIRGQSPQVYEKINEELEDDNNMNVKMNNDESLDIIQLYASVLEILVDLDEEASTNENASQEYLSNLSMVSTILCDELVKEFLDVKQDTKAVEDELVDLFKSFNIKKNNSSIENNLSKILSNIRL
jgi:hypothetical protein